MKYNWNRSASLLAASLVLLLSAGCSDEENNAPRIDIPDTYNFTRNGESTVSFSGQTARILMAEEIISGLLDTDRTEAALDAMYAHEPNENNFSDPTLNSSDKNIRSKTAASVDLFAGNATLSAEIRADFEEWIAGQVSEVYPKWEDDASEGVAGQLQEAGGGAIRYINANGLEYNQAFGKSLIGALMVDQALNNYLSTAVLDEGSNIDNNDAKAPDGDNSYTTMEHKWDEAYGYVYGTSENTTNPNATIGQDDSFLNKYIGRVEGDEDFSGIADEIFEAFLAGRAAIVAGDYNRRDQEADIIKQKISEIIAIRSVYYLLTAKAGLEAPSPDMAAVFHDLSEAYGFIYSLQFTKNPTTDAPYFSHEEVEDFLRKLYPEDNGQNGFWDVSTEDLDELAEDIAGAFEFTSEETL
jgi:hypothetical protein